MENAETHIVGELDGGGGVAGRCRDPDGELEVALGVFGGRGSATNNFDGDMVVMDDARNVPDVDIVVDVLFPEP